MKYVEIPIYENILKFYLDNGDDEKVKINGHILRAKENYIYSSFCSVCEKRVYQYAKTKCNNYTSCHDKHTDYVICSSCGHKIKLMLDLK